ncbi:GNAT family N-acetyltransferase [Paenisporosarcina quisquiliarum]|uniref:GNAT family N-acetyltransferase n=1 Tax=Paenisporosarcina quisquiliarum TaxID=365346 RepID=UPI00373547F1
MLRLVEITKDNWRDVIRLRSAEDEVNRQFERFIASNTVSLAQASIEGTWTTRAIYHDDQLIGFAMYGYAEELGGYEICRLMIDYTQQGKGYGKQSIALILDELKKIEDCKDVLICFEPENEIAKALYEQVGFDNTGQITHGELVYKLSFE